MFVYLYLLATFILLVIPYFLFFFNRNYFSYNWWALLGLFLLMYAFIYQAGPWPYAGYAWRYYSIILLTFFYCLRFFRKRKQDQKVKKNRILPAILITCFCLLLIYANAEVIGGNYSSVKSIDLRFPLANGKYAIEQGGNSAITNISHRYRIPGSLALDIIKLNGNGMRGGKFFSKDVHDYAIYGDTVVSPCDCIVTTVYDGIKDNIPPHMNTDHRGGNFVILQKGDIHIILCHMQNHSIVVKKGQQLKAGDTIGRVGNTGFSIEPHLHIQAYRKSIYDGDQVPIRFDGKILKMNDVVESE